MIVRMASVRVAPERIDKIVEGYREIVRPVHQRSEGLLYHCTCSSTETALR